jgi:hypothetical protein
MAQFYEALDADLSAFIAAQKVFFVATAPTRGRVNLSPKGMDTLRILSLRRIVWLSVTGSGNETAAHVLENGRMTLMWWAVEGPPRIVRAYGRARAVYPGAEDWGELLAHFPSLPGTRQIFDLALEAVQTSCGMSLPLYDFAGERDALNRWAESKGPDGLARYRRDKNVRSIDGLPTGLEDDCES